MTITYVQSESGKWMDGCMYIHYPGPSHQLLALSKALQKGASDHALPRLQSRGIPVSSVWADFSSSEVYILVNSYLDCLPFPVHKKQEPQYIYIAVDGVFLSPPTTQTPCGRPPTQLTALLDVLTGRSQQRHNQSESLRDPSPPHQ